MTSSMEWADGSAGGTPLDAANLDKLAVTADLGVVGSRSGESLEDAVAAMLVDGAGIDVAYDDVAGTVTVTNIGIPVAVGNLPALMVMSRVQNSDGSWPSRPTSRTDIDVMWIRIVAGSSNPSSAVSPDTSGAYLNDVVVGL